MLCETKVHYTHDSVPALLGQEPEIWLSELSFEHANEQKHFPFVEG